MDSRTYKVTVYYSILLTSVYALFPLDFYKKELREVGLRGRYLLLYLYNLLISILRLIRETNRNNNELYPSSLRYSKYL